LEIPAFQVFAERVGDQIAQEITREGRR